MKVILGKKIGMTQVFLPTGEVVPVTRVLAGPCTVTQVRKDASSIQLGFGGKKEFRMNKSQVGHLSGLSLHDELREFTLNKVEGIERGDEVTLDTFSAGDTVEVIGISKGKGFAGVVKRHHFHGGPASHGHKDNLRAPGSIGAGGVQRVFKGMRMAGHMGDAQVTVKNLEIVQVHPETGELYVKGAIPGGRNALVVIKGDGELKISKKENKKPTEAAQETVQNTEKQEQIEQASV
jgi:large subunit ribosomal protein L3